MKDRRAQKAAYYLANRERIRANNTAWRLANPEKWNAQGRAWRLAHPQKNKEHLDRYRATHREELKVKRIAYRAANLEKARSAVRSWQKANPEKQAARAAKRRALLLQRTALWAGPDTFIAIYEMCATLRQECGFEWHVDHIIPLQGKLVSGLHVVENLQCLPASENCKKRNKFEPTNYGEPL